MLVLRAGQVLTAPKQLTLILPRVSHDTEGKPYSGDAQDILPLLTESVKGEAWMQETKDCDGL